MYRKPEACNGYSKCKEGYTKARQEIWKPASQFHMLEYDGATVKQTAMQKLYRLTSLQFVKEFETQLPSKYRVCGKYTRIFLCWLK